MKQHYFGNCLNRLKRLCHKYIQPPIIFIYTDPSLYNSSSFFIIKKAFIRILSVLLSLLAINFTNKPYAQEKGVPSVLPDVKYHLTARAWKALNISRNAYLDKVEGTVQEVAKFQDLSGAIIDPYANIEVQYATPYFANAVATLISAGRSADLLAKGVSAMNKATKDVAEGAWSVPDNHGEFFLAPLASAIPLYTPFVSASQVQTWKNRMAKPIDGIIRGNIKNWRTYAMKGEWYRAKNGYVNKDSAIAWIESSWINTQRNRFTNNLWNFYHDYTSDPDTWPYESAARGNLLAMIADGYDGASRNEMLDILKRGTQASLLLQDPSGQGVAGGRTGNHTWNDIVLANGYEIMAEIVYKAGNERLAGQYRRAATLGFQSVQRWRRTDGTYSVTKNHFDHKDRNKYASYSYLTNYNGYMMFHMAENYLNNKSNITEQPAPNEIGGYTIVSDSVLATAVANAGGMHMEVCLRGATQAIYNNYWTTLGVVRFARPGWDSRLGPSDGVRETATRYGVSFAPTFLENGKWVRLASMPERYEAFFSTQFAHPLLVRCRVDYKPKTGHIGPSFTNDFTITPDGILSTLTSSLSANYGITWPLLTFDGATYLNYSLTSHIASTSFPNETDQQNYIALHPYPTITATDSTRRSSYGNLRPVRMISGTDSNTTFIYPRNAGDPAAEYIQQSFIRSGNNFSTILGTVKENIYIGRTSAGGEGSSIDLDNDTTSEVSFDTTTGFILQLSFGEITKIETNRAVSAIIYGQRMELQAYTPVDIKHPLMAPTAKVIASVDDGNVAMNTVDRDYSTRWSGYGNGQWIRYELDTTEILNTVKIAWYKGNERKAFFEIQTSLDSTTWTTVFSGQSSGASTTLESYTISRTPARYVRIIGNGNSIHTWNAITEVQLVRAPKVKMIASSDDGNVPANTVDKNFNTRWSAYGNNQWIKYELNIKETIKAVKIAWYRGNERKALFDIQTSLDSINWTTVFSGQSSGLTKDFEIYPIPSIPAHYIRIIGHGNTMNQWNAITEVEFIKENEEEIIY